MPHAKLESDGMALKWDGWDGWVSAGTYSPIGPIGPLRPILVSSVSSLPIQPKIPERLLHMRQVMIYRAQLFELLWRDHIGDYRHPQDLNQESELGAPCNQGFTLDGL